MKLHNEYGYMIIDGMPHKIKLEPGLTENKWEFVKTDKRKFDAKVKKAEWMAEKLETSLDKKAVLMEALSKIDGKDFEKLYTQLKGKKKYKPKTRKHHCVDMQIRNFILPIVV